MSEDRAQRRTARGLDPARRSMNQANILVGFVVVLIGAAALLAAGADTLEIAILLGANGGVLGLFLMINATQRVMSDPFMDLFFWSAMVMQLPLFGLATWSAQDVRPVVLLFSMVLLGIVILRATTLQTLGYGAAVFGVYIASSVLASTFRPDNNDLASDVYYGLVWLPILGVMAYLAGHQHRVRARAIEQRQAFEALAEDRMAFVREISHEIRNPLTMVLGPLDELMQESGDAPAIRVAFRNAQRLTRQVDRLLKAAESGASRSRLKLVRLDLGALLRGIVEAYFEAPAPGGVTVSLHTEGGLWVMADPEAVETVVMNYVTNAIKYSPEKGRVRVIAKSTPEGIRLSVSDQGPGIRPEDQASLFAPSRSVGDRRSRRAGTGLGLSRVRALADAMGATVGVDSRPGQGSRFSIVLQPAAPSGPRSNRHLLESTVIVSDAALGAEGSLAQIPDVLPETYVLVVEHDEDLRNGTVRILESAGFGAVGVSDEDDAMTCVSRQQPELLVTDWTPAAEGPTLVVRIREDAALHSLPVVLLTARADPDSRAAGMKAGADGYIAKPFDREELVSVVSNLLRLKERENEIRELNRRLREEVFGRFLPPSLVDAVVEGRMSFDDAPETRSITTLVVDIVGFTQLTERMRATGIASYLSDYFRLVSEVVLHNRGFVDKLLGDGVLVHFGAPVREPVEAQVASAAACARMLHERVQELDQHWRRRGLGATRLRIGVHHGPAAVGYLGTDVRTEYTAVGPSVNLAFRLRSVCRPGETFVSGVVADYLDMRDLAPLSDVRADGLGGALPLFRLRAGSKAPAVAPSKAPHSLDPGERFGPYRVVRRIGLGGMAVVYQVHHETLDRDNALKVLLDPSQALAARLVEEGKIQARLTSPNIVPVLDVITVRGQPALVMPLVEGCSLEDLLTRYLFPEDEAVGVTAAIAEGLAVAHRAHVIHRDLKPANVLLDTATGSVVPRVTDFGLARDHSQKRERGGPKGPLETLTGQFLGTPIYAAPEQFRDASRVGPPADVWALGAVLFELLTGRCPFVNGPFSLIRDQVDRGRYDDRRVPERWRPLIARMLATDPEGRPTAQQVQTELRASGMASRALQTSRILGLVIDEEPTQIR